MVNAFIITCLSGLSTIIGGFFIFFKFKNENINKFITFSLSLSCSIMIGLSVTELIPESFFEILKHFGIIKGQYVILIISLIAYFIIIILNKILNKKQNDLYKIGILSMLALIIHNLPEGIAVFSSTYQDTSLGIKLAFSISLHNIPEGISIAVPIYYATNNKVIAFKYLLLSALAEPLGALITYIFLKNYISPIFLKIILLFVGVLMITLAIKEIFPKAKSYKFTEYLNLGFFLGLIILILISV